MPVPMPFSMRRLTALASLCLLALGATQASADCEYTKTIEQQLAVGSASSLMIKALAGQLEVVGARTDEISVVGKVCAERQAHLELMRVELVPSEAGILLAAVIPRGHDGPYGTGSIDLTVTLPEALLTRIADSSGDLTVDNARVEHIQDSSGHIEVKRNQGDLIIDDSSGDIDVSGIRGKLTLGDSSGDIDVFDVEGDMLVKHDSSGNIEIRQVAGDLEITQDSSGDIEIRNVAGQVAIGSDGSGNIEISEVGKSVTIGNDGSGIVRVSDVKGDLTLAAKGEGHTEARNISGATTGF